MGCSQVSLTRSQGKLPTRVTCPPRACISRTAHACARSTAAQPQASCGFVCHCNCHQYNCCCCCCCCCCSVMLHMLLLLLGVKSAALTLSTLFIGRPAIWQIPVLVSVLEVNLAKLIVLGACACHSMIRSMSLYDPLLLWQQLTFALKYSMMTMH